MAFLEVRNFKKSFGATKVLNDVSFSMDQGQVVAIIGSSGSGKTTLLRCLNFLEKPDSGTLFVSGQQIPLGGKAPKGKFGLVFQNFNLFPQYTALQNVMLAPGLQKGADKNQLRQNAISLLAQVGLEEKVNHYPWQLSGGQQQRVAIARALALQPEILCFDEPTSALDPELTGEVLQAIVNLKKQGKTMIVVTHEMGFAKSVADVIIYMAEGVVVEQGTPKQVFENPQNPKTRSFLSGSQQMFDGEAQE